jgi:quercetin dioxygenase-like cupin family protein
MLSTGPGAFWFAGMAVQVLADAAATGGELSVCALTAPAGTATPLHRHTLEDEIVVVHAGALRVRMHGAPARTLRPGESLLLPRDVPHGLAAAPGADARFLAVWSPGGFETALAAAGTPDAARTADPDDVAAHFAGAGVWLLPDPDGARPRGSTLPGRHAAAPDPGT